MVIMGQKTPFDGDPALTEAQRAAVLREGHTLLAAGAGSGKTTTLVDKILHALGAERIPGAAPARRCELDEIVAITFTNAAAADLKDKLRRRIRKVAEWQAINGTEGEAKRWRNRIHEVDRARIGTIHSFCGQLLREFALRLGTDPGFRMLDEGEASIVRSECAAIVVRQALEKEPLALELVAQLGIAGTETLVADFAGERDLVAEVLGAWFEDDGAPRDAALRAAAERHHADLELDGLPWNDEVDPYASGLAGLVLRLASRTAERMAERLDAEGALDFDAVITRTRDALRDRPDVLAAVRRRLAWLFIDEFQDTDRAQLDIAYLISGFAEQAAGAPSLCIVGDPKQSIYRFRRADVTLWRQVERDFEAQSIAPIALVTNFRSRTPIVGFVNATFAGLIGDASKAVLEAGHEVSYAPLEPFRRTTSAEDCGVELLDARAPVDPNGKTSAATERTALAEAVVARMQAMRAGTGDERVVWDDKAKAFRPMSWKDVAILFRARTAIPAFEAVLRRHGVPYYVAGGSGFFARREVRDIKLLLAAILDPQDDIAWLGLLRSPLVGVTDETILRQRVRHPAQPLSALLDDRDLPGEGEVLRRARGWLPVLGQMRDRVTVSELIAFAVEQSAYAEYLLAQQGGEVPLANVRKLVRMAEGRPADTVAELLAFMEEREDGEARDGDAALFTAGEDVVTLTTVHSAKGLEWPVVFLTDLSRDMTADNRKPLLIADPDAGVALDAFDPGMYGEARTSSAAWQCLYDRHRAIGMSEEKRLWYVAATRARDRLVLCTSMRELADAEARAQAKRDKGEDAPLKHAMQWLLRSVRQEGDGLEYTNGVASFVVATTVAPVSGSVATEQAEVAEPMPLPCVAALCATATVLDKALVRRLAPIAAPAHLPRRSATELMLLAKSPEDYRAKYQWGLPDRRIFARVSDAPVPAGVPANILGDVLHGALEEARDSAELDDFLEHELMAQLGDAAGSARVTAAVMHLRRLVEQSRAHPAVVRLYDAERSARELSFTWFARSQSGVTLLRGAMDLVGEVDGKLEILDYKSHRLKAGEEQATADGYDVQLDVYAAALGALSGSAPSKFSFFFPETGTEVVRELGGEAVAASLARVGTLLDAARAAHVVA